MKNIVFFFPLLFLISSCTIYGLTNDWKKLSAAEKSKVIPLQNFNALNPYNIYTLNGKRLKQELKKYPQSLVYVFTNGCSSAMCKPLKVYEAYAKENRYELFLVMNGFGNLNKTTVQALSSPLFAIDNNYYKSNIRTKYTRFFENDVCGKPLSEKNKEYLGNLFFFKRDTLEKIARDLAQ